MANNFDSNFTRKLAEGVLAATDSERVISKNVNTQLLEGKFNSKSGQNVDFKRSVDMVAKETSDGDISAGTRSDMITGKATGTTQNIITVDFDFDEVDEALKGAGEDRFLKAAARRVITKLELNFGLYAMKNAGLLAGTVGTAATTWDHVAEAGSVMQAHGVPMDQEWYYTVNPFTQRNLASNTRAMGAGGVAGSPILTAHQRAMIDSNFAGMQVMTGTTMGSYTTPAGADRAGTLSGNPDVTYVTAKDTMTQVLPVTAFQANLVVKAGEKIKIAGRYRLNLATREVILDENGSKIEWTGTVTEDVTLGASGEGYITVTGPAIYEATGAYNTVDSAPVSGDVVTLLASASSTVQPNLFWHRDAFGIGFVPMKKLYSTDTLAFGEDGLQLRVSKYANGDANKQIVRIDIHPAFATFNPFFAGHGFGS